jgi:ribosome-binding factor A
MRSESRRQKRVARLIQEALGPILARELEPGSATLLSLTHVEVPSDLRSARVYISVFGGESEPVLRRLAERSGALRKSLAALVELKYNPELFFALDPSADMNERIERLLRSTKSHGTDPD